MSLLIVISLKLLDALKLSSGSGSMSRVQDRHSVYWTSASVGGSTGVSDSSRPSSDSTSLQAPRYVASDLTQPLVAILAAQLAIPTWLQKIERPTGREREAKEPRWVRVDVYIRVQDEASESSPSPLPTRSLSPVIAAGIAAGIAVPYIAANASTIVATGFIAKSTYFSGCIIWHIDFSSRTWSSNPREFEMSPKNEYSLKNQARSNCLIVCSASLILLHSIDLLFTKMSNDFSV